MQALVLAGGQGTRLRPLTLSVPKPVMPLAGRPFLSYMLDWLQSHGVDDVILSCGFMSDGVRAVLGDEYEGMRLRYVTEDEPLDTAGPVRLAASLGLLDERVLVLNGDVLTDMDLSAQIDWHARHGGHATLALVEVDDTCSYGVVPTRHDGRVEAFLEKSAAPAPTNRVNAGAYVLERELIESIPAGRPASFEREVFPGIVGNGLYGFHAQGYWIDIGTPERYLEATRDLVSGRLPNRQAAPGRCALVDGTARVDGARIAPGTVVGPGCRVGRDSVLTRSVLHRDVMVGRGCALRDSVLADGVSVGERSVLGPGTLVGEGATIAPATWLPAGARVQPGEHVS
jgi:mannose-1-phosphate guanylyltransferase